MLEAVREALERRERPAGMVAELMKLICRACYIEKADSILLKSSFRLTAG